MTVNGDAVRLRLMLAVLEREPNDPEAEMINMVGGRICCSTGYQGIRRAIRKLAARKLGEAV